MKRSFIPVCLLIGLGLGLSSSYAQEKSVKQVPAKPTTATSGKVLFAQYCAVCHGPDAKGKGPAADALKTPPGDLTQLKMHNGGKFPEKAVMDTFRGSGNVKAHGSQDMPVWGPIFSGMSSSPNLGQDRVHALLQFLEDIQAK